MILFFRIMYKIIFFWFWSYVKEGVFFSLISAGTYIIWILKGRWALFLEALQSEYYCFYTYIVRIRTRTRSNSRFYFSQAWILRNNCISFRACFVVFADTFGGAVRLFFCDVGVFLIGNFKIVLGVELWVFFWG